MSDETKEAGKNEAPAAPAAPAEAGKKPQSKKQLSDAEMEKVTLTTAEQLKRQPKEKIKLYLKPEERQKLEALVASGKKVIWPYETVQLNGYTFQIQRGKEVSVPQSIAEILRQANMI